MDALWGRVHAGDKVYAADGRAWTVMARDTEREWRHEGKEARFTLALNGRETTIWRMLDRPVQLAEQADHSDTARAVQALIDNGIRFDILEERVVTTAEPQAAAPQVKRDRYGRYLLPDPETGTERTWTRATTIARVLADAYNLGQWAERMVAKGMALRPDLVAGAAAADPNADKGTLQSIAQQAKDHAGAKSGANLGTALHTFTERLDKGEKIESLAAPHPLEADLRAYQRLMARAKLRVLPQFIERTILTPQLGKGIAGKIDRMVRTPDSDVLRILDLKTGKDLNYSWLEIAQQQAIYANARLAWNAEKREYEPMPDNVDTQIGYILHLPVGKATAQLYEVNLAEGWRLAQIAIEVKSSRSTAKGLARVIEFPETSDDILPQITHAADQQTLAGLWETYHPRGLWTNEVHAYAEARLRQLTQA